LAEENVPMQQNYKNDIKFCISFKANKIILASSMSLFEVKLTDEQLKW